ncbi:hypothetical protein D3C71_2170060 [compost metagenome]
MPGREDREPPLFGTARARPAHEDFLALVGAADPEAFAVFLVESHAGVGAVDLEPEAIAASGRHLADRQ